MVNWGLPGLVGLCKALLCYNLNPTPSIHTTPQRQKTHSLGIAAHNTFSFKAAFWQPASQKRVNVSSRVQVGILHSRVMSVAGTLIQDRGDSSWFLSSPDWWRHPHLAKVSIPYGYWLVRTPYGWCFPFPEAVPIKGNTLQIHWPSEGKQDTQRNFWTLTREKERTGFKLLLCRGFAFDINQLWSTCADFGARPRTQNIVLRDLLSSLPRETKF